MPKLTPIRRRRIRRILNWLRDNYDIDLPDLPEGRTCHPFECPVARAFSTKYPGSCVGSDTYTVVRPGEQLEKLPPFVRAFTNEFDNGLWPEYEE